MVHLFDRESDEDLGRAVVEAIARRGERGLVPGEFRDRYDHHAIAGQFATQLASRTRTVTGGLDGERGPQAP